MSFDFVIDPFKSLYNDKSISLDNLFFSSLLILLPIVLITGPALPDIFLSLIALFFLVKSILKKKWQYYKNPIVFGFLIFSIYGVIRSLLYEVPIDSLTNGGSVFYFRYIFFALGVWYLLDINPHLPRCMTVILVLSIITVSLDGLYQFLFGVNFFGFKYYSVDRLTGFFRDEPILGRYIAYLSIFTFALIYQNFQKTKKMIILSVSFLVISEVVVFLSGDRAPFFYMVLFAILILIFVPKFRFFKIIGILFSIIIILFFTQNNLNVKHRMFDHSINQVSQTKLPFLPYSPHHEGHYLSSLKMFLDKPLFGIGTNSFRFECDKITYKYNDRSCSTHPHNYYIQTLAELGIFGFLLLFTFFMYLFYIGLRQFFFTIQSKNNKLLTLDFLLFPMVLFIYWWPLIPHMSLYNNWNNVLMMLPLGFFMRYLYNNKNNGNIKSI
jgi:O-antigen ligase